MKTNKRTLPPMVGGSSLLMIFAVLCLTVFTLLSLSTTQADRRLSEISAQAVTNYYAADLQAERIFAQLRRGERPESVQADGNLYRYCCAVSDTQALMVELLEENGQWKILRWQTVSANL